MATGARATQGAHRAAADACAWIGRAVGRSHSRLAQDIRAARRGDLKSGLHRLTDRSLGKLRARAAELGLEPDEYTATLRCLLLPADPECRTRVFFGVGAGGLFRLRGGEWQDIEPRTWDTAGEPVVGFGSPPAETPDGDRLTMDLGITTPPSPYEPAPAYHTFDLSTQLTGAVNEGRDLLVAWGWMPGSGREPAPGSLAEFGALVAAWAALGASAVTAICAIAAVARVGARFDHAPLARIVQAGLVKVNRPDEEVQAAMDEAALREIPKIATRTPSTSSMSRSPTTATAMESPDALCFSSSRSERANASTSVRSSTSIADSWRSVTSGAPSFEPEKTAPGMTVAAADCAALQPRPLPHAGGRGGRLLLPVDARRSGGCRAAACRPRCSW